jgi:hypothetical protein
MTRYCRTCDERGVDLFVFKSWWQVVKHIWRMHVKGSR